MYKRQTPDGDAIVLTGEKRYVEAGAVAGTFLVTARTGAGLTQVLVPADAEGVTVARNRSVDMTRRFATVTLDGVRLPAAAVVGEVGSAAAAVERQVTLALALQCAEMVGVADRALELTLEYGRDRFAFGRPIVSFQALKHRIADMTVWIEGSKAVADALAAAVEDARLQLAVVDRCLVDGRQVGGDPRGRPGREGLDGLDRPDRPVGPGLRGRVRHQAPLRSSSASARACLCSSGVPNVARSTIARRP